MRVHLCSNEAPLEAVELPWETSLGQWPSHLFVDVPRGISRNVVRFAIVRGSIFALKEIPDQAVSEEYRLLRALRTLEMPVVEPIALFTERADVSGQTLPGLLITRFLEFSLPYRILLGGPKQTVHHHHLLDAMAYLLVQLHLAGFYWGDCSLSNTLFKRDAGGLAAYMVDAETGELHETISDGMRQYDLELAEMNIAGELMDVASGQGLVEDIDPIETAGELVSRYFRLWEELNHDELIARDERFRVEARIKRLQGLGFAVDEMELITCDGGHRLVMRPRVVEPGFHRRLLHTLTGLVAEENQGRSLLNDIYRYRAFLEQEKDTVLPQSLAAIRWLTDVYQPTIDAVPAELRGKLDGPEIFHQILEHRWFMSEKAGRDVGAEEALHSYLESILPALPSDDIIGYLE